MHTIVIKVWRGIVSEVYSDDPNTEIVIAPRSIFLWRL